MGFFDKKPKPNEYLVTLCEKERGAYFKEYRQIVSAYTAMEAESRVKANALAHEPSKEWQLYDIKKL